MKPFENGVLSALVLPLSWAFGCFRSNEVKTQ